MLPETAKDKKRQDVCPVSFLSVIAVHGLVNAVFYAAFDGIGRLFAGFGKVLGILILHGAQNPVGHVVVGMWGSPYAHTKPGKLIGTKMSDDALQAVVPAGAAAGAQPDPAGSKGNLIRHHQHMVRADLVKISQRTDGFTGKVHVCLGLYQKNLFPGNIFEDPKGISGTDGDYYTLTNQSGSKYMSVNPSVGEVNLNIDSSKEYIDQSTGALQPRREGEDWIHMILSQTAGVVYLDEVDELIMELDFTLTECEIYDNSIGAAQFQWIFSVHDKASSAMEKEYFWFNVTLFDNRYEIFPGTQMFDGGKADATGKFIFAPTGQQLFGESGGKVEVGTTYHIRLNLKEYMQNAFNIAKEKGALKNSSWENMAVNGFNIGWEVSNVSKVGVKISNMSLKTK